MNKLKITLASIIAILVLAICGVIGCYIADNHGQVLSWLKNEKTQANIEPPQEQPTDPIEPLPESELNALNDYCEKNNVMVLLRIASSVPNSAIDLNVFNEYQAGEVGSYLTYFPIPYEGYTFTGYSLTENGEPIESLQFETKVVAVFALFEKQETIQVTLHFGGESITKDVYKDYDYSVTDAWINWFGDYYTDFGYIYLDGFVTSPEETENAKPSISESGDYYMVFRDQFLPWEEQTVNSSKMLLVKQHMDGDVCNNYLYVPSRKTQLLESFQMNANYLSWDYRFKGWATSPDSSDTIEIFEETFDTYTEFYSVFKTAKNVVIYYTNIHNTMGEYYDDVIVSQDGSILNMGYTVLHLCSNIEFAGFTKDKESTDSLIDTITESGEYYLVYRDKSSQNLISSSEISSILVSVRMKDDFYGPDLYAFQCVFLTSQRDDCANYINNYDYSQYGDYKLYGFCASFNEDGCQDFVEQVDGTYIENRLDVCAIIEQSDEL